MGRIGEGEPSSGTGPECCMCGDHGLSSELFTCKNCGFRSQHKYCSNLYPRAESYHICNWCLSQKDDKKGEETSKSSQNSSHKTTSDHHDTIKIKKSKRDHDSLDRRTIDHNRIKKQIKKLPAAPPDRAAPPPSAGLKRVVSDRGGISEKTIIKRSRSESNGGMIVKPVFRNKVRRYKLLDEVSS